MKLPPELDKRRKLSEEDKQDIINLYSRGVSIREISRKYENIVCRRSIQFILFPERRIKMMENMDWRRYFDRADLTARVRDIRRRKQKLLNEMSKDEKEKIKEEYKKRKGL